MRTAVVEVQRQSDLATVVPPACLYFEWDQLLSLRALQQRGGVDR